MPSRRPGRTWERARAIRTARRAFIRSGACRMRPKTLGDRPNGQRAKPTTAVPRTLPKGGGRRRRSGQLPDGL